MSFFFFVIYSCYFYHILILFTVLIRYAHTIRRLSNYKSRVSVVFFLCLFACVSLGYDINSTVRFATQEKKITQFNYSCDNIVLCYTKYKTNWTYFIRDSIITESIRLVNDGNAEMRNEAVKYSELYFSIVYTYVFIIIMVFCVCRFFFVPLVCCFKK